MTLPWLGVLVRGGKGGEEGRVQELGSRGRKDKSSVEIPRV